MLSLDLTPKLIDLGFAREVPYIENYEEVAESDRAMTCLGTDEFMAPEMMFSQPYYLPADVYSFGITVYEVCTKCVPERNAMNGFCVDWEDTSEDMKRLDDAPDIPEGLVSLIQYTAADEAMDRSTMRDAYDWLYDMGNEVGNEDGGGVNVLDEDEILKELTSKWEKMIGEEEQKSQQDMTSRFMKDDGDKNEVNELRRMSVTRALAPMGDNGDTFSIDSDESQNKTSNEIEFGSKKVKIEQPEEMRTPPPIPPKPRNLPRIGARSVRRSRRNLREKQKTRKRNMPSYKSFRNEEERLKDVDEKLNGESDSELEESEDERLRRSGQKIVKIRTSNPLNVPNKLEQPLMGQNIVRSSSLVEKREKQRRKEIKNTIKKKKKSGNSEAAKKELVEVSRNPLKKTKTNIVNFIKHRSWVPKNTPRPSEETFEFDFGSKKTSGILIIEREDPDESKLVRQDSSKTVFNSIKRSFKRMVDRNNLNKSMTSRPGAKSSFGNIDFRASEPMDLLDEEIIRRQKSAERSADEIRKKNLSKQGSRRRVTDKRGFLIQKNGFGFWKKVWVITTGEGLIYFKDEAAQRKQQVRGAYLFMDMPMDINKTAARVVSVAQVGKPNCFMLLMNDKQRILQAKSRESRDEWVRIINGRYKEWTKKEAIRKLSY
eukprot:maker-scaffold_69-snap-gene-0.51-mRNA-1 protein AED:0.00 eAED:0.00 QI:122/1/1/1/1/1/2/49/655